VVESFTVQLKADSVLHPLDVAECLSQAARAVIAPQVDLSAPFFNQAMSCHDPQRPAAFTAWEKALFFPRQKSRDEKHLKRNLAGFVYQNEFL